MRIRLPTEASTLTRLAVLTSHPIQYHAPLFRVLAGCVDLTVFFAHKATAQEQSRAGFGTAFEWDIDLTSGYTHDFLQNISALPGTDAFAGCDTPDIAARLSAGKFDALLVMGWHLKSYVQGIYAAKRLRLPVMVRGDSHLGTPRPALKLAAKSLIYPPLLRLFDAALYVGVRSRAYYETYRFPQQRLFPSPHCVDTEWFADRSTAQARAELRRDLGVADRTTLLLFAGKLLPFKRPGDLLEAAARCRQNGSPIEVMIAGDGALREQIIAEAARLQVPLHLLGFCNQSRMPAVYSASDGLVLPSEGETWGLVANEALACGRPIIVSDACGCAPDLTRDSRAGRVYPMADIAALATSITALAKAPRAPMAIDAISQAFSLKKATEGIVAALDTVLVRRARSLA